MEICLHQQLFESSYGQTHGQSHRRINCVADVVTESLPLSILTTILYDESGLASTRMSPFWILLELRITEAVVTTGAIRHAKLQSKCHHQHTNTHLFYRMDALPAAQPTVSEHYYYYHVLRAKLNMC